MSIIVCAKFEGSLISGAKGLPCPTSQKGHLRVHKSPNIIKVAVPWLKHSPIFGQDASSQTVFNLLSRNKFLIRENSLECGSCIFIHFGLASLALGIILIGILDVLSFPVCFICGSTLFIIFF